ncbi:MAG: DNA alkylation repair protein [Planctomycetes bacterium]|nr:DNA alkylation repair protein [Planctomycetota bacterium]
MNSNEVLLELESLGSEPNRKVHARHGIRGPMFGVGAGAIGRLAKRIGIDDLLAVELWASGNHDARVLATRIADPAATRRARVQAWAKDLGDHVLADALAALVTRSPDAAALREAFTAAGDEWRSTLGWNLVALACAEGSTALDEELTRRLAAIEAGIHGRPNRTRHAMNRALIAIGERGGAIGKRALAVAKAIGTVEVDHGGTGCKTTDAVTAIRARTHRPAKRTRSDRAERS